MRFDIISIFPESFTAYFGVSMLKRAQEDGLIEIHTHSLRDFTHDKHKTVDDTPYGGGAGMLLKAGPLAEAIEAVRAELGIPARPAGGKNPSVAKALASLAESRRAGRQESPTPHPRGLEDSLRARFDGAPARRAGEQAVPSSTSPFQGEGREGFEQKTRTILFSAKGKLFAQEDARRLAQYERLILVCGRYEGVDERVAEHFVDEELSIGDYVLTGGELPAMVVVDAVARLLPGVLGNVESAETESHTSPGVVEYPQYTKPETFRGWRVPEVLISGHHGEIAKWKEEQSKKMSQRRKRMIR